MKLMIVDDEMLVRIGVKSSINWGKLGFEIIGEAANGREALELCEKCVPDIVLTDIKMPEMDGLELIKRLKQKYPDIKIIVLSCFNDFELVKVAFKLGANDYILKLSMDETSLTEVLEKVKLELSLKREINEKKEGTCVKKGLKARIIDSINNGTVDDTALNELLTVEGMYGCSDNFIVIEIVVGRYYYEKRKVIPEAILEELPFEDLINGILSKYARHIVLCIKPFRFLVIAGFEAPRGARELLERLKLLISELKKVLKNYVDVSVSMGISGWKCDYQGVARGITEASLANEMRFYRGCGSTNNYSEDIFNSEVRLFPKDIISEFIKYVETGDEDKVKRFVEDILRIVESRKNIRPVYVQKAVLNIIYALEEMVRYIGGTPEAAVGVSCVPFKEIERYETFKELSLWVKNMVAVFVDYISSNRRGRYSDIIDRAKKFVIENMDKKISLNAAASYANVTPSYLSRLFKKEMGVGFNSYVTKAKIEKAKELMTKYNEKTEIVATKVGFSNLNYFVRLFKQIEGITVNEFRQRKKG